MRSFILFIGLTFPLVLSAGGAGTEVERTYDKERIDAAYLDSLEDRFGIRKEVPEAYRRPFLIALSAYPELKHVRISVQEGDFRTTMAARPTPKSLLAPPHIRSYRIMVDTLDPASEGKLFKELPFQARIGIMAHELAHVLDYSQRGFAGILRYGVRYLFKGQREELEARTDRIAVERGFGWQLLAFKEHLRTKAELDPNYRAYKERVYLSHQELRSILREHPDYSPGVAER
jgi:hypothetical protein